MIGVAAVNLKSVFRMTYSRVSVNFRLQDYQVEYDDNLE